MEPVRVLIVDDSVFIRAALAEVLSRDPGIRVVGEAENGLEALNRLAVLKPDLITMDIDMPVMDGLEAIERIMATAPVPILVITSASDAEVAYSAISKGALEVIPKPDSVAAMTELTRKVKLLAEIRVISHIRHPERRPPVSCEPGPGCSGVENIVAIAASTGGPRALAVLLSGLPVELGAPVVIAQHIADNFVTGLVQWLNTVSHMPVKTGEAGEKLRNGTVYVSPSESHMEIAPGHIIAFRARQTGEFYTPSCDRLLMSAARIYGPGTVGVILTGMGNDGLRGMKAIRDAGGFTIAQDEKTSVVFGMPKVAIESGCIARILPIQDIHGEIVRRIRRAAGNAVWT